MRSSLKFLRHSAAARQQGRLQFCWTLILFAVCFTLLASVSAFGQVANGSLSGIVKDVSDAVIPGAQVVLKDEATGIERQTVSNSTGYFHFAAVPPGTYTVTISMKSFSGWQQRNVVFNQAENRTLPTIALKPSVGSEAVEVVADATAAPLETSESRQTINSQMVTDLAIQGRNASELIKIMPGMAFNRGLNNSAWDSLTTQTNSGPIGDYSASGTQPHGGMTMTSDGANILDIGNMGTQTANINQDQTSEITLLNSSFGAEFAKGPVTFQAITKSGGAHFHGSGYFYTRNGVFNATDAYLKANKVEKPDDKYYYPGFTFGGPVVIPGTGFNKNRDKLFFFTGYEYMKQTPQGTLYQSVVPTDAMLAGDFSGVGVFAGDTRRIPCDSANTELTSQWYWGAYCGSGGSTAILNGNISSLLDPNALALAKFLPKPNQDPRTHSGYNYGILDSTPVDRWEFKTKIDYNITQNTHLSATYGRQSEGNTNRFGVWWWPSGTVPYPSTLQATTLSRIITANLTHVFTPTMTNEVVFAYSFFTFPPKFTDPDVVNPANVTGYSNPTIFKDTGILPQIPNIVSWTCNSGGPNGCFPHLYAPSMSTGFNDGFGNRKSVPSIADNFSKVIGSHTLKTGFYFDMAAQAQTSGYGSWAQGILTFDNWTGSTTGNYLADFLIGHGQYTQAEKVPVQDMRFKQLSFYAQDSWKATGRLTLTYGLRFDHLGQWYPTGDHPGFAVWDSSLYDNKSTAQPYSGMTWHARDNSIPISGWPSKWSYSPRIGVAYDIFGEGKTVLRGGFGVYPWQVTANDVGGSYSVPLGIRTTTVSMTHLADIASFSAGSLGSFNGDSSFALKRGDDRVPYTQNWNVIISQQLPGKSTLELQYAGNRTQNGLMTGNGDNRNFVQNLNKIPLGALFGPDPITGAPCPPNPAAGLACDPNLWSNYPIDGPYKGQNLESHFRPYQNYGKALIDVTHGSYSNYNAFMATWNKQSGNINFMLNYTFSKVLGIRDGQSNNGTGNGTTVDPFNLRNNYGVLNYDHTQIFNASYVFRLPTLVRGNAVLGQVVNGWEISGITQLQSGPPLQPLTGGNLHAALPTGTRTILGTDESAILMPYLTCDPKSGLKSGQYFNPDCFAVPNVVGKNGPSVMPYLRGPAYFNSDLSFNKSFKVAERQSLQVRFSTFNLFNHPLKQFERTDDTTLRLRRVAGQPDNTPIGQVKYEQFNPNFTGKPAYTAGRRVMEFGIKYLF